MSQNLKSTDQKFSTVIEKNTFYYFDQKFEENYEGYLHSIKEILMNLKFEIENNGLHKETIEKIISEKENGLRAILALTGLSNEVFKRLITVIRVADDSELNKVIFKDQWGKDRNENFTKGVSEWSDGYIQTLLRDNVPFRKGLVNILFEGASIPFLIRKIPLFELKKLSISKLSFDVNEMIDTLIRYKEKGSYSGKSKNNPETLITNILDAKNIPHVNGDLNELIKFAPDNKRTMDIIIPNKKNPRIIIESSFLVTTSSGQGDKSKTELSIDSLLRHHYPNAKFVGFIDGIGWYVRKGDLKRMVNAYFDVFTFHPDELIRFDEFVQDEMSNI